MNTKNITLIASLLILSSCGAKNSFKPADPTNNKEEPQKSALCAPVTPFKSTDIADYEVVLSPEVIANVLNDMIYIPNYSMFNFWKDIQVGIRDELNFELNILLASTKSYDPLQVYRTTAVFFDKILGNYHSDSEYRIRDANGRTISFKTKGQVPKNIQNMGSGCANNNNSNVTFVKLSDDLINADEVKEIYRCKTAEKAFYLQEARNQYLINADGKIFKASVSQSKRDDNKRKLELKIKTPDFRLVLNIRKKTEKEVGNFLGKKANIDLKLPEFEINEVGACNALKSAL
jgi:hypothetical protein